MYFTNTNGSAISVVRTCLVEKDIIDLYSSTLEQGIEISIDIDSLLSKLRLRNNNLNSSVVYIDNEFNTAKAPDVCKVIIANKGDKVEISLITGDSNQLNTLCHANDKNQLIIACATDMEALFKTNEILDSKVKKLMTGWYFGKQRTGFEAIEALNGKKFELLCGNYVALKGNELVVEDGCAELKHNSLIERISYGYKSLCKQKNHIKWPERTNEIKALLDSISKSPDIDYGELNVVEKIEALLRNFYLHELDWEKRIVANLCIYEILTMPE